MQRQTAVTDYLKSEQLLLFAFVYIYHHPMSPSLVYGGVDRVADLYYITYIILHYIYRDSAYDDVFHSSIRILV